MEKKSGGSKIVPENLQDLKTKKYTMDINRLRNGKIIILNHGKILLKILILIIKQENGFIYVSVLKIIIHLPIVDVNMVFIMIQLLRGWRM